MIMNRFDYKIAMMALFNRLDSYSEKRRVNAMNTAHREFRGEVNSISQFLTRDRNEAGDVIRDLLPLNPRAATFYGIPKIHNVTETNLGFRPIVSSVGTLTMG